MRRFPALYRMPVFYLGLAIAGIVTLATWRARPREGDLARYPSLPVPSLKVAQSPTPTALPVAAPTARPAASTDAFLMTSSSLRYKILVSGREVFPRTTPGGETSQTRLEPMSIRFIHEETPSQALVGPALGSPDGWIPRAAVVEWNSRLFARPTSRATRPAVEIYAERACLVAAMASRECPRHAGRCPVEIDETEAGAGPSVPGWPILSSGTVPSSDGTPRRIFEVAPIALDSIPTEAERLAPLRPWLKHVYIAFVIDTTASMKAAIGPARAMAERLATDLARTQTDVILHLGLVEYRDDAPGLGFKAKVATPFTDANGFRGIINSLESALKEDATAGECLLDGLTLALPGKSGRLDWPVGRPGDLATKLIVVLGDAPDHDRDLLRAESLATQAKAAGITIATVAFDRTGSLSDADRTRLREQSRVLTEGSYRPPDSSRGFTTPIAPIAIEASESTTLASRLRTLVDDRIERAQEMVRLATAEDEGRLSDYLATRQMTMVQVAPILDDLRRGGPAPRRINRKPPAFRQGWLAERRGDTEFVRVEVLLAREELDLLIRELDGATPEGWRAITNAAALGELPFLDTDRTRMTVEDQKQRRLTLPGTPRSDPPSPDRIRTVLDELRRRRQSFELVFDPRLRLGEFTTVPFDLIDP